MKTSESGRKMIEDFEGVRLKAYQDQRGIWTIGVGHTEGVKQGDTCTFAKADAWLAEDLSVAEAAVTRNVTVPLNQNQFDALVSLTFNIGSGNFAQSTVRRLLNENNVQGAADAFMMWKKTGGEDNPGLVNRRTIERRLFLEPVAAEQQQTPAGA